MSHRHQVVSRLKQEVNGLDSGRKDVDGTGSGLGDIQVHVVNEIIVAEMSKVFIDVPYSAWQSAG